MKALIDFDIIVHAVSAACENVFYAVPYAGNVELFKYKADAEAYCAYNDIPPALIEKNSDPSPFSHAAHSANLMISSILSDTQAKEYMGYITGPGNFRKQICPEYKAHRTSERPTHFEELKAYLISHHPCVVTNGIEADDAIGIEQCKNQIPWEAYTDTIICSTDKDFNNIPGWHYRWDTKEKWFVTEEDANWHFYAQMLAGDKADNITGIRGIGLKTGLKLLADMSVPEMACFVGLKYAIAFDNPEEMYYKNQKLLWILRDLEELRGY